ncbi:MAG: peptidase MA family metallohydrolase [Bacillota bacterium]
MKRIWNIKEGFIVIIIVLLVMAIIPGIFYKDVLKVKLYPLFREVQKAIILSNVKDYQQLETEHFIIHYQTEDEDIIPLIAEASEKHYSDVSRQLGYFPKEKTDVIVYHDPDALMKNANLGQGKPPMGVYYASTIQILSPKLWVQEGEDMEKLFMNEGPMVHEFTHLLVDDLTRGNYPMWFTEGMALYQEYVQTGYQWGKELSYEGEPYTLEQLSGEFDNLDIMLAYKRSFEIVKTIAENGGLNNLNDVLKELGEGKNFDQATEEVYQMRAEDLYK